MTNNKEGTMMADHSHNDHVGREVLRWGWLTGLFALAWVILLHLIR